MLITSFLFSSPSLKSIVFLIFFKLTLSLPECLMEFCNVTLTFESADKILWCDHSDETSLPVLTHGAICFSQNEIWKFGRSLLLAKLGSERVKKLVCLLVGYFVCVVWYCSVSFRSLYYVRANNDEGLTLETSPFQTLFLVVVIRVNKEIFKTSSMSWFLYHRVGSIDLILE